VLLGAILQGAQGKIAKEITSALNISTFSKEEVGMAFRHWIAKTVGGKGGLCIQFALVLIFGRGLEPCEGFIKTLEEDYRAKIVGGVSEEGLTTESVDLINGWAKSETNGLIHSLFDISKPLLPLTASTFSAHAAITFECAWAKPFNPTKTMRGRFVNTEGESIKVLFMSKTSGRFRYGVHKTGHDDGFSVLMIAYAEKGFSMYIILPSKIDGLGLVEKKIFHEKGFITNIEDKVYNLPKNTKITVKLPKLVAENTVLSLKNQLKTTFEPGASDFRAIAGDVQTHLVDLQQMSTRLVLNEQGTNITVAEAPKKIVEKTISSAAAACFNADHPFVFIIQDNSTSGLLFLGKVVNPLSSS
jgi:serpin B